MDWTQYLQAVLSLIFVVALIGIVVVALRRFGFGTPTPTMGRNKRVRIMEVTVVDGRRRLVLVRHDDREHLILLGQNAETVVDSRDAPDEAIIAATQARAAKAPPSFGEALGKALGGRSVGGHGAGTAGEKETSS